MAYYTDLALEDAIHNNHEAIAIQPLEGLVPFDGRGMRAGDTPPYRSIDCFSLTNSMQ